MKGRELAIAVAEKLDDKITWKGEISLECVTTIGCELRKVWITTDEYLHDKAGKILLSEGMAANFDEHLGDTFPLIEDEHDYFEVSQWWASVQDNGTLTPEKILNAWLELEKDDE